MLIMANSAYLLSSDEYGVSWAIQATHSACTLSNKCNNPSNKHFLYGQVSGTVRATRITKQHLRAIPSSVSLINQAHYYNPLILLPRIPAESPPSLLKAAQYAFVPEQKADLI